MIARNQFLGKLFADAHYSSQLTIFEFLPTAVLLSNFLAHCVSPTWAPLSRVHVFLFLFTSRNSHHPHYCSTPSSPVATKLPTPFLSPSHGLDRNHFHTYNIYQRWSVELVFLQNPFLGPTLCRRSPR